MEQHNHSRGAQLAWFKLLKAEWNLLAQLFPVLDLSFMIMKYESSLMLSWWQVFLSATKQIPSHSTPLLHHVIPLFDIITQKLNGFVDDGKLHPCVCITAVWGWMMLNKYYRLSDDSVMYRIAMSKLLPNLLLLICIWVTFFQYSCIPSTNLHTSQSTRMDQVSRGPPQMSVDRLLQTNLIGNQCNSLFCESWPVNIYFSLFNVVCV